MRGSFAFFERNLNLARRYAAWEIAFLFYSVAAALSVSLIGVAQNSERLLLTLIIGTVFWDYMSLVFSSISDTIQMERWEGTLEYTMMAPVRRVSQLLGSVLYSMVYGFMHTAAIFVFLFLFFPKLDFGHANLLTAGVFVLLGSLSFIGLGMVAATLPMLWVERGSQMASIFQAVLLLVSGVYYSVTILPDWMQVISSLSPATYMLDGVRNGILDGMPIETQLHHIWPLLVSGIVLTPLGLWIFGVAERHAKEIGSLKRVG